MESFEKKELVSLTVDVKKRPEISEKEIMEKLHLYHSTSKEKWEKIKKQGKIMSIAELIKNRFLSENDPEDLLSDAASSGIMDKQHGRDNSIFLSHKPSNMGDVVLEIDPEILNREDVMVATAGDLIHFIGKEDDEKYFKNSIIKGSEFISYLKKYLTDIENDDLFWRENIKKERLQNLFGEAMLERVRDKNDDKFRAYMRLFPEVMVQGEIPMEYIKSVQFSQENK